jgi:4-diphosphocytidyl-2-C-methyl-D-erythritol kinase
MVVFPNAKINLGLFVERKRADGYHDITSCFLPVKGLYDVLEVLIAKEDHFVTTGLPIAGSLEDNLVMKAVKILKAKHSIPPLHIHLHKVIPSGAGVGGGSADGAFALKAVNELCGLQLDDNELLKLALGLGSDCPFFIYNTPAIGCGRGEILFPIDIPEIAGKLILLVNPGIHVSTKEAFAAVKPKPMSFDLDKLLQTKQVSEWHTFLVNDFEESVFAVHPEIALIKDVLLKNGALYAAMSGSGSSVYGIFESQIPIQFPLHYTSIWCAL